MSSFIGLGFDSEPEKEKKKPAGIDSLNDLFGIPKSSKYEVIEIPIKDLVEYRRHKFSPSPDAKRQAVKESIKEFGVLDPIQVREASDIPYEIDGKYEILAGHQRTSLSQELGLETVPAIVKRGLTEDEAYQIHAETNWPRFEEMPHSERAAMLAAHYEAMQNRNVRKDVLDEINSYLKSYSNPVESKDEDGLSQIATGGIREVAKESGLSKDMIARYLRIDTLNDELKELLDKGDIPMGAAVELSYIKSENQDMLVTFIQENDYKCDIKKAKSIRALQEKGKLTMVTMEEALGGKVTTTKKKSSAPKGYKVDGKVIKKYFVNGEDDKEIGDIIEAALQKYFGR